MAEESVRSLVSEENEEDENLNQGVFPGITMDAEDEPETGNKKPIFSRREKRKPRELNIRINEPTGTQVKVRTEEVDLSYQVDHLSDTQKVNLGKLKEGPKSVRVQVEVNHTSSNSSVEVTRSNDGSTVVKTVEEGTEKEHLYNADGEALILDRTESESVWEKNQIPEEGCAYWLVISWAPADGKARSGESVLAKGIISVYKTADAEADPIYQLETKVYIQEAGQ